jgi:hypothetical protein
MRGAAQLELPSVVIRQRLGGPRMAARWKQGVVILPLALIMLAQTNAKEAAFVLGCTLAFCAIVLGLAAWLLGNTSLALTEHAIVRTSPFGRRAELDRRQVEMVVEAPLSLTRASPISETWLLFIGSGGRTLLRAYADYYTPEQLARFRAGLGTRWERLAPMPLETARQSYPGSFGWQWAHPWLMTLAVLFAGFALATVVAGGL